ncbi:transglutaminase-like domain-containing protein [Dehalobacter sp. MCB1]|uniref:transglutaminase-like domain-containing protein n=1 Tax=Dehalobacter sp. MCB1 TaxID=1844756 RepID=UPI0013148CC2|nr:transglutaminase-like domain-containing protein [Dehalobacter sp. MCB1]
MKYGYLPKEIMLFLISLGIGIFLLCEGGFATDIPFIYDGTSWVQAEELPPLGTTITDIVLAEIFDLRVEPNNDDIASLAMDIAIKYPGGQSAGQIVAIYDYMINGDAYTGPWLYVDHQSDYYMYASHILKDGIRNGGSGRGNCNDFAILMASLMDAVGYSTRIVHAYHQNSGHAYAEVYLGTNGTQVDAVVKWLGEFYRKNISLHVNKDPNTNDVWLNLDWQRDSMDQCYAGGPFCGADNNSVVWMTKKPERIPVRAEPVILSYPIEITNLRNGSSVPPNVNLEGTSRAGRTGLKAYVLIWPIESGGPWWVQDTVTSQNGNWNSNVVFGRPGNIDNGKSFKVMAVITRENLSTGSISVLPPNVSEFKSKEIIVHRGNT